jgi:predicted TIM-barrel fold metal-dependent hydrolase
MSIVDVHAHYHPRAFLAALSKAMGRDIGPFVPHPDTDDPEHIETRLRQMDEAGVGLQVIAPAAGRAPYGKDEATSLEAARLANDLHAELVSRYPDKFKALVTVPLPHVDASLKELDRALALPGMIGLNLHISALDRSVAEDEFLPVYEEMDRRRGVIVYHPCGNAICSPMIADYGFGGAVGTSLEDAAIVLHLIAKQIPHKFPNITFIVPHFGGPIAMLLDRLNNQFSMKAHNLPEHPKDTARRFYYDTVGHGSHAAMTCARMAYGADHILVGSDFPVLHSFETYDRTINWIRDVEMPAEELEMILEKNAPRVLGL